MNAKLAADRKYPPLNDKRQLRVGEVMTTSDGVRWLVMEVHPTMLFGNTLLARVPPRCKPEDQGVTWRWAPADDDPCASVRL